MNRNRNTPKDERIEFKFIKDREIEWKIKSLTLSQDTDWKYYVSILVEREITELSKLERV